HRARRAGRGARRGGRAQRAPAADGGDQQPARRPGTATPAARRDRGQRGARRGRGRGGARRGAALRAGRRRRARRPRGRAPATGVGPGPAAQTAQAIVLADVWGVHSHGLLRLPFYLQRLTAGGCNPAARLRPVTDTGPLVTYDGENGLGHWQLWQAAQTAARRCAASGVAVAAVGRSSHCGALGVYTLPLLDAGYVALVFSHGPAVMPPWGGTAPVLSTSPIAA